MDEQDNIACICQLLYTITLPIRASDVSI